MIFSTPLAAIGFVTLVGLTALYCFRRKSPPRTVSSLLFWPKPTRSAAAARRRDSLRLPPIFWLEFFILLALVTAALSPLGWRASTGTLHVIVDDTPSMHAGGTASPAARAAAYLAQEKRHPTKDAIRVRTVSRTDAFRRALVAAQTVRAPEDEILVLTDHAPNEAQRKIVGLHWEAFGTAATNLALTAARRLRKNPTQDSLFLEVRRFGDSPSTVPLTIGTHTTTLTFDAAGRARFRGTVPASDQPIAVSLPPDTLAADNTLTLPPPDVPSVDASLQIGDKALAALVKRALDATGYVHQLVTPEKAALVITDDPIRPFPNVPYRLVFTPGGQSLQTGPVWTDPGSDLLDGVSLAGEAYACAPTPLPGTPIALLGSQPLVSAATNFCAVAFANPAHAFFRTPAFPALIQNVLVTVDAQTRKPMAAVPTNLLDSEESDLTACTTMRLHNPAPPPPDAVRTASFAWIPALLAVLALVLHIFFIRRRTTLLVLVLALLALARPVLPISEHRGTLIVVADHSRSMPANAATEQTQILKTLAAQRPDNASLGVVTFGATAAIEKRPAASGFGEFIQTVNPDGSDLSTALTKAAALADPESPTRFLVLSDGLFTTPLPPAGTHPVDTFLQTRPFEHDLFISRLDAPAQVSPRTVIPLTAWVQTTETVTNDYTLTRGTNVIARGRRTFARGFTPLVFRDRAGRGGLRHYTLTVTPSAKDPYPENNSASTVVSVEGTHPVLFLTERGTSPTAAALKAAGYSVESRTLDTFPTSLAALGNYAGVVLENLPAKKVPTDFQRALVSFVSDLGRGLALTGGERSYGPGGWYKSAIEDILPVTLELRQEHRKYALALAIVLDRSGSMTCLTSDGRTKMEMANLGTAGAIDMLSPADEVAVIAVDSSPHLILQLQDAETAKGRRDEVLSIASMGGGIFVKEGLIAGLRQLERASTPIRHLILFADASDAEEPGDYKEYLAKAREAGITVSVIGLGSRHDCDSKLLEEIATLGGGECWFEERAEEIPRLFLQDTFLTAKSAMCTNLTPLKVAAPLRQLSDRLPVRLPAIGGYNLTYARPEAEIAILTEDEDHAPLLATRRVGLGRTVAFTGELSGPHAAPLMTSPHGTELAAAIVRGVQGADVFKSGGFTFERRLVAGGVRVTAVADDDNPSTLLSQAGIPLVVIKDRPGLGTERTEIALTWDSAETLTAFVPLASDETAFLVARPPEGSPVVLPPIRLPYSAEFRRGSNPSEGKETLERLAAQTGGRALAAIDNLWSQLPTTRQYRALAPWIFLIAAMLFLFLVFARRLGWHVPWSFTRTQTPPPPKTAPPSKPVTPSPTTPAAPATPAPSTPTPSSTASALARAKRRANGKWGA